MDFFDFLTMTGGLALFLYGMQLLSESLGKLSGGRFVFILKRMTNNRKRTVILGAVVTALIQSSSAVTVMVVGLVDAGMMNLSQAAGVIMGANVGTTFTSWLLCLSQLKSDSFFIRLLKPASFSPVMAIIGVFLLLFGKKEKRRNIGSVLVGFSLLMTGMDTMSQAMSPLSRSPRFAGVLTMFSHPLFGLAAGAALTALIQSSSASVGILQALCSTGSVSYAVALPIILGQNIGTCATAMLSTVGAGRNAKRAALIHLLFNVIGAAAFMVLFYTADALFHFSFLSRPADSPGIALIHTGFNLLATLLLLPFMDTLEILALEIIRPEKGHRCVKTVSPFFPFCGILSAEQGKYRNRTRRKRL